MLINLFLDSPAKAILITFAGVYCNIIFDFPEKIEYIQKNTNNAILQSWTYYIVQWLRHLQL